MKPVIDHIPLITNETASGIHNLDVKKKAQLAWIDTTVNLILIGLLTVIGVFAFGALCHCLVVIFHAGGNFAAWFLHLNNL